MRSFIGVLVVSLLTACGSKTHQSSALGVRTAPHVSECQAENPNCKKIPEITAANCTTQNSVKVLEALGAEAAREFSYQCNVSIWHNF